jgi:hypothetical protein
MESMKKTMKCLFFKFYQEYMQASKKLPEREKLSKIIASTQG